MEESLNEALLTAQHFCIILSEEIKRSQKALLEKKSLNADDPTTSQSVALAKLARLKAELDQENISSPPLHHPLAVSTMLLKDLENYFEQTQKLVKIVKERCSFLDSAVEEKENLILEQVKLHEALLDRLQTQPNPPSATEQSEFLTSYDKELAEKRRKSEKMKRDVKKKMTQFTQRHFPLPSSSSDDCSLDEVLSLNQIIDDLIKLSVHKPENPYLTLGALHWPPHIELLLRHGLASRHPTSAKKIKLCDLHL